MNKILNLLVLFFILNCSHSIFAQTWFKIGDHLCAANSAKDKPFFEAVKKANSKQLEQLLQKGSDTNLTDDCNISAIVYIVHQLRPDILKRLIASGADVNVIDGFYAKPPLLWVIDELAVGHDKEKSYESVQLLIDGGANVNLVGKSEKSALILAVLLQDEQLVKMLISAGADINLKDSDDRTAYSYAAEIGNKFLKNLLIQSGADLNIGVAEYKKQYQENAFFQAAADGRTDVVEAMIANGTDVNAKNAVQATALMRTFHQTTVDALINAGADVNLKNDAGFTALIWAASFGKKDLVLKLIAAGADVNAETLDGKTALDFADNPQIQIALIKAGAKIK